MRSSSVKTLVSAVTLTFTLIVAAPPAEAKPSQPKYTSQAAPALAGVTERAQRAIRQLLQRAFRIATNILPTDPHPVPSTVGTPETATGDEDGILPSDPRP